MVSEPWRLAQEYHNDLKRLGMSRQQVEALRVTGHDGAYYYDIWIIVVMFVAMGLVAFYFQ